MIMSFIFPFLASILQSASFILDKSILSIKKASREQYLGLSFPLIAIFTFAIFLIFNPPFNSQLFSAKYFFLLALSIIMSIASNLIFYSALKTDLLSEIQTIELLKELPLIIFSAIIFSDERNYFIIALSLISACSVIWSHWQKKGFGIAKKTLPLLIWNLLANPFRGIISKALLEIWNPISLQLIRDGTIGLIFFLIFFKDIKKMPKKAIPFLLLTNLLTSIAWIFYYYSYQSLGIIYTVLIFSLQPLIVYFAGLIFFKEKFSPKKLISFIIILIAIVLAQS